MSLPACALTAPNSSARWRSTRTATGSASCVAPRASSSGWPSSSADLHGGAGGGPRQHRISPGLPPSLALRPMLSSGLADPAVCARELLEHGFVYSHARYADKPGAWKYAGEVFATATEGDPLGRDMPELDVV